MTIFDPPHIEGCCCPDTKGRLIAALQDRAPDPCPVHDAGQIAATGARADADQMRQVIDEMKAGDELARRRQAHEAQVQADEDALSAITDPLDQAIARATHRPPSSLGLNLPLSSYPSLAGFTPDDAA